MSDEKTCIRCRETKPASEYRRRPDVMGRLYNRCKTCDAAYLRRWRIDNPGHMSEWRANNPNYHREWRAENRDQENRCQRERRAKNVEKERHRSRACHQRRRARRRSQELAKLENYLNETGNLRQDEASK